MSSPPTAPQAGGLTCAGKIVVLVFILACIGGAAYLFMGKGSGAKDAGTNNAAPGVTAKEEGSMELKAPAAAFDASDLVPTQTEAPKLAPPLAYVPKDPNVLDIELSEYAGYAGLIAANGGLAPNPNSPLTQKSGLQLNIKISEEESWNALNTGKMGASATTADVLAVYGRQFSVVVPAQIGYSRGADGLVVKSDIKRINDLKGKVVVSSQFTESDFFLRFLAREANISVGLLADLNTPADPDAINVVYAKDGFAAGDVFEKSLKADGPLAGACTWAPKTSEIPAESNGKAKLIVSNKNLLIIADILIVNRGYADKYPDKVAALTDGLLMGNNMVRQNPAEYADVIGKAFKWDRAKTVAELQKVHLPNLPENQAFFSGGITQGGSFASIFQSAILAYGDKLIPNPADSDRFVLADPLKKAQASGAYAAQTASIVPLAAASGGALELDPVLSKDIRFFFEPNSDRLDMNNRDNIANLGSIKRILDISPGSHIVLVGHVDNSNIANLRAQGGESLVQKMAMEAMDLSKRRAAEVQRQLIAHEKVDAKRLEVVPRGWSQPVSQTNPDLNRRVEVQWFTLE